MDEKRIQSIVEAVLTRLKDEQSTPFKELPFEASGELKKTVPDITQVDLRNQYLVDSPQDREAFLALKEQTPARVGVGHAGARYRTSTRLRFLADHAAAQDAVFSDVSDAFLKEMNLKVFQTECSDRDEFLTRPDKGRIFGAQTLAQMKECIAQNPSVLLYLADGLSSTAVTANARDVLPVIQNGLKGMGIKVSDPFFVRFGRVGTMDCLGDAFHPDVVCVLLGERPGLVTAQSMSAYIAYRPHTDMPESNRTVVANIHGGGTPPVEAGAFIAELIRMMLQKKASGLNLPI